LDELGYNELYVSVMYGAGFIGGLFGLYFFGAYAEYTSHAHACQICFICNFCGVVIPIFAPENIILNILSRGIVGTAAIVVVCQVWVSRLNDDPIYMNYFMQSTGITLFIGLLINGILDITLNDIMLQWKIVHIIGASVSILTSLFIFTTKISEGTQSSVIINTTSPPLHYSFLMKSLYFGFIEMIKCVLILYILSIDYDIRIMYLVGIMFCMNIINLIISPRIQRYFTTHYKYSHTLRINALISAFLFALGTYIISIEMYSGILLIVLGNIFHTISFALTTSKINFYVNQNAADMRVYLLLDRIGMCLSSLGTIPMYVNLHPGSVSGLILILYILSFWVIPVPNHQT
jgi:hypothetical protein